VSDWAIQILVLLFGTTTMLQAFVVPSGSMDQSLKVGDHLFVDKLAYAPNDAVSSKLLPYSEVKRGDVIVFRYPLDITSNYVKRCMGVPGDRIRIAGKNVYLNGHKLSEPYAQHIDPGADPYRDSFPPEAPIDAVAWPTQRAREMVRDYARGGELVVPPGYYFALGDNRDNSADSRYWGLVPRENIIGKPLFIYWSFDAPTEQLISPTPSAEHLFDVAAHFFTKTRWERTFHFVRSYPVE
jgi:signal peptidase I